MKFKIRDRIDRSIRRAAMVETPEHLADASQDAYYLAKEVEMLRQRIQTMVNAHNNALSQLPRWKFQDWSR